jgi:hypothetical protein
LPPPGNQYLEARYPWVPGHGYVLSITAERLEELESDLAAQSTCSQAVPKIPVAMRRAGCCASSASRRDISPM